MSDKQSITPMLREEFDRWDALLAGLSEEQATAAQLEDNWSIKDVVAHLNAWQQRSVARLDAALNNHEPEYPAWPKQLDPEIEGEPNDLNAWLYAQSRDQSWATVYQNWRTVFLRVLELGEAIPEADLVENGKYSWLEEYPLIGVLQGTYEHHHEHAENLAPVLARMKTA